MAEIIYVKTRDGVVLRFVDKSVLAGWLSSGRLAESSHLTDDDLWLDLDNRWKPLTVLIERMGLSLPLVVVDDRVLRLEALPDISDDQIEEPIEQPELDLGPAPEVVLQQESGLGLDSVLSVGSEADASLEEGASEAEAVPEPELELEPELEPEQEVEAEPQAAPEVELEVEPAVDDEIDSSSKPEITGEFGIVRVPEDTDDAAIVPTTEMSSLESSALESPVLESPDDEGEHPVAHSRKEFAAIRDDEALRRYQEAPVAPLTDSMQGLEPEIKIEKIKLFDPKVAFESEVDDFKGFNNGRSARRIVMISAGVLVVAVAMFGVFSLVQTRNQDVAATGAVAAADVIVGDVTARVIVADSSVKVDRSAEVTAAEVTAAEVTAAEVTAVDAEVTDTGVEPAPVPAPGLVRAVEPIPAPSSARAVEPIPAPGLVRAVEPIPAPSPARAVEPIPAPVPVPTPVPTQDAAARTGGLGEYDAHMSAGVRGLLEDGGKALAHFQAAHQIKPRMVEPLSKMGDASFSLGRLENASGYYQRALKVNEQYTPAIIGLARVNKALGNSGDAKYFYTRYLDVNPKGSQATEARQYLGKQ